jgi:hypothetical protein
LDTLRERFLAGLLGGFGTILGLMVYQGAPEIIRYDFITIRLPNFVYFLIAIFIVGFLCGFIGHLLYLRLKRALVERALIVGSSTGLAIALIGWTVTYLFQEILFPFELFDGVHARFFVYLRNALVAGPTGGVLVSLMMSRWIRRRGYVEPP